MTHNLVYELDGLAVGMASPSLARDIVSSAAREIDRLTAERSRHITQRGELSKTIQNQAETIARLRAALFKLAIRENGDWQRSHSCLICRRCVYTMKQNGPSEFNTGHSPDCVLANEQKP